MCLLLCMSTCVCLLLHAYSCMLTPLTHTVLYLLFLILMLYSCYFSYCLKSSHGVIFFPLLSLWLFALLQVASPSSCLMYNKYLCKSHKYLCKSYPPPSKSPLEIFSSISTPERTSLAPLFLKTVHHKTNQKIMLFCQM